MLSKFIYIVDSNSYLSFLKSGIYKVIPDSLMFKFQHKINPRVVCKYRDLEKDRLIGYGIGILCTYKDVNKESFIEKVILSIKQLSLPEVDTLIMSTDNLSKEDIKKIEDECDIRISKGTDILLELFIYILSKICNEGSWDLREQEVVMICDGTSRTNKIISQLSERVKFLTIFGEDKEHIANIKEEIFNSCGLSLYSTDNINRYLSDYNVIINLSNNMYLDLGKIKRKTIVFDLSEDKTLKDSIKTRRRDIMCISDVIFKNTTSIESDPIGYEFDIEIESNIYEVISDVKAENFIKIKVNDKSYYINEALDLYFKKIYKKTVFKVK